MEHNEHVDLLRPANLAPAGTWADLGAGAGAFTLALRELLGPDANIYGVDLDPARLAELERAWRARFRDPGNLHILLADFNRDLAAPAGSLPALDGVLMANSLHFFKDKQPVLHRVHSFLKPGGALLVVEYNVDMGNMWVPYPFSFETWRRLATQAGFSEPRLLATRDSNFLHGFYAALASKQ